MAYNIFLQNIFTYELTQIAEAMGDEELVEGLLRLLGGNVALRLDDPDLDPGVLLGLVVGLGGRVVGGLGVPLEISRGARLGGVISASGVVSATRVATAARILPR